MEGSAEFTLSCGWSSESLHYCRATAPLPAVSQTLSLPDIEGDAVGEEEAED